MRRSTATPAALLFFSGACALTYQTVWFRQFRLIFGASTFATAAVLAIFMGGLGVGSGLLGRRADAHPKPLVFYGNLELLIAASAAVSQVLLWLVAKIYFATGGSVTLGIFVATVVRLILAAIVLVVPTVMMGGTLPAAARAVETNDDNARRNVALLYGVNTLGAVTGTLFSTFFALEVFGNRKTLLVAVLVNVVVAVIARSVGARPLPASQPPLPAGEGGRRPGEGRDRYAALAAAAIVGFAFLLMELVWYRMLAPLLGGSTFTFGLILAVALLGIGLGGAAYSFWSGGGRATTAGFALTCSLEAVAIAFPFALGDRLAVAEAFLRDLGQFGFGGYVLAWTLLTIIVVLPAAFIAGVQFPLLISLLGSGREDVGRDVGHAYAWNTAGAIAGSLAGGFGLIPLLSAPGAWRLVIVLLALLGIAAAVAGRAFFAGIFAVVAIGGTFALGPTAAWRHSGIGVGRAEIPKTSNGLRGWIQKARRTLVWDADGRESAVALIAPDDYAFVVNGKVDGSARGDDGTQVMAGLVGAILLPNPQRSLVIGLGTGSTAGWLGAVPTMQRVDVVELEPAVLGVAKACTPVNHDVLHNPKVHIRIGDAREVLLATPEHYDIIFSEPSNPYRAGIASLFTEEFYQASKARLNSGGVFLQWLQAYSVEPATIRTIFATIGHVFPNVETWQTDSGDLLLVATEKPINYDVDAIRRRVAMEPFASALTRVWDVQGAEGFLSHFVATDAVTRSLARKETLRNTDDQTLIEFGFARSVAEEAFDVNDLTNYALARGGERPQNVRGAIDWNLFYSHRVSVTYMYQPPPKVWLELQTRRRAALAYDKGNLADVVTAWREHPFEPVNSAEQRMLGESLANVGDATALRFATALRPLAPIDATTIVARLAFRRGNMQLAAQLVSSAFSAYHHNAWPNVDLMRRAIELPPLIAKTRSFAPAMAATFDQPWAAGQWQEERRVRRILLDHEVFGCAASTMSALHAVEPWPPWREDVLRIRRDCYVSAHDSRASD
ncbi:MAG TPA: fused MFS/spermidine synthase, partial [Thermoanaerobaculia bacterium]